MEKLEDSVRNNILISGLVIIVSFIAIPMLSPWFGLIETSGDQGINLAKAALLNNGIGPYGAVWNDQGPVLTIILAALQKIAPWNVVAARLVIVGFAAIMLGITHFMVRAQYGAYAGLASALLLGTSCLFVQLASAVMIGLPAISFAMMAMAVLISRPTQTSRIVLSGILFALALQTKIFVFTLIPAFMLTLATGSDGKSRSILLWAIVCFMVFGAISIIEGQSIVGNLISPHVAMTPKKFPYPSGAVMVKGLAVTDRLVVAMGLLGIAKCIYQFRSGGRLSMIAATWLVFPTIALCFHFPVWDQQLLLLLPPLAWLGGPVLSDLVVYSIRRLPVPHVAREILIFSTLVVGTAGSAMLGFIRPNMAVDSELRAAGETLREFAGLGKTVVTDRPILAFSAGLNVPPELAVWSNKRVQIGEISDDEVMSIVQRDNPAQILLQRFPASKS